MNDALPLHPLPLLPTRPAPHTRWAPSAVPLLPQPTATQALIKPSQPEGRFLPMFRFGRFLFYAGLFGILLGVLVTRH